MQSLRMLRRVAIVVFDVSGERVASIFRAEKIRERREAVVVC
jgi:hypothetical protein